MTAAVSGTVEASLVAANAEAAEANDEDWKDEVEAAKTKSTKSSSGPGFLSRQEKMGRLEALLSKAERYTQFLGRKLMSVSMAARGSASGDEAKDSDAENKSGNGKRKRKSPRRNAASSKRGKTNSGASSKKAEATPPKSSYQPKSLVGGTLRDYQVEGLKWLVGLWENGLHGILADEMGLGKTIQVISLMAHLWDQHAWGHHLIVVPLSTLTNWISEFQKWAPEIPVLMYHGTKDDRPMLIRKHLAGRSRDVVPVVITTYEIICRDRPELQRFPWKYVIVDEGHRLKNMNCRLVRELNILAGAKNASVTRLLLTGTPLQNNLKELWSLLNFLLPDIFDDLEFFMQVFDFDSSMDASSAQDGEVLAAEKSDQIVSKLHRILSPFMMRRLKAQVEKAMPKKKEIVLYVPMTPAQKQMYDMILKENGAQFRKVMEKATGRKTALNNIVMQLRKCSLHPFLHYEPTDASGNFTTDESLVEASGKMVILDALLRQLRQEKRKVLIFSQFTTLLDILEDYFRELRPDMKYCRIDGGTKLEDRRDQMLAFNDPDSEQFVFLLSTRAGGVGINLATADTVVIFDSDWNPHQDNQAQDRAHRIGQKNDVFVYRFITARSVELKILARANSKRKLERVVCANNASHAAKTKNLTTEDLLAMLEDDFTGHKASGDETGELDIKTLMRVLDRDAVMEGKVPQKGKGYEIVEHKASAIVGSINA